MWGKSHITAHPQSRVKAAAGEAEYSRSCDIPSKVKQLGLEIGSGCGTFIFLSDAARLILLESAVGAVTRVFDHHQVNADAINES